LDRTKITSPACHSYSHQPQAFICDELTKGLSYDPASQVTRMTDPKGNQTNITYDAQGNPLTITDADNKGQEKGSGVFS
jgi:YD repeat-containing protein